MNSLQKHITKQCVAKHLGVSEEHIANVTKVVTGEGFATMASVHIKPKFVHISVSFGAVKVSGDVRTRVWQFPRPAEATRHAVMVEELYRDLGFEVRTVTR